MSAISKNKRIIETNIADKDGKVRNLLNHLSVQLSDGYWENEEDFYREYWNWLDFESPNKTLQIIVNATPCWDDCPDIFSDKTDAEIIHYVGNVLDSCYDCADNVFKDFDNTEKVIDLLLNHEASVKKVTEFKSCPFCGSDKLGVSVSAGNNCYYKQVYCKKCHTYGPRYRKANKYGTQDYTSRYNFEHEGKSDLDAIKLWNNRMERIKV